MIFLIFLIILFIYLNYTKNNEHFTISNYLFINDLQHDEHQDIIMNNSNENKSN